MHDFIKSTTDIESLARGGKILAAVLREVAQKVAPGISTFELNELAERRIEERGAKPSFKGYGSAKNPYPAALCTSVNSVVVHGIPRRDQVLAEGDIIGLDLGVLFEGLYTDAAITVPVGRVDDEAERLIETARKALLAALTSIRAGCTVGDIGAAIQEVAEGAGFSVVRDLVGHGVGYDVHEEPAIPCFGRRGEGMRLVEGMVIAVEPMINEGGWKIKSHEDGWTVTTADGSRSAHFEHTVAVTKDGVRVLTEL